MGAISFFVSARDDVGASADREGTRGPFEGARGPRGGARAPSRSATGSCEGARVPSRSATGPFEGARAPSRSRRGPSEGARGTSGSAAPATNDRDRPRRPPHPRSATTRPPAPDVSPFVAVPNARSQIGKNTL